jgi:hypothetical protein
LKVSEKLSSYAFTGTISYIPHINHERQKLPGTFYNLELKDVQKLEGQAYLRQSQNSS